MNDKFHKLILFSNAKGEQFWHAFGDYASMPALVEAVREHAKAGNFISAKTFEKVELLD